MRSGNKAKKPGRRYRGTTAAAGQPSGEVTPDDNGEDGTQEADDGIYDEAGFDSELREAESREATSSDSQVERLEAQIEQLHAL